MTLLFPRPPLLQLETEGRLWFHCPSELDSLELQIVVIVAKVKDNICQHLHHSDMTASFLW